MKHLILFGLLLTTSLLAQDLQIKSKTFHADEKSGISVFEGDVNIIKASDELNASKVTVYTDDKNQPTKFIAEGKASFTILTEEGSLYKGKAHKVVYLPNEKEYRFFKNVHLKQINEKKEIIGDEVILKTIDGKAYAKGDKEKPVIMIFKMPKKDDEKNDKK